MQTQTTCCSFPVHLAEQQAADSQPTVILGVHHRARPHTQPRPHPARGAYAQQPVRAVWLQTDFHIRQLGLVAHDELHLLELALSAGQAQGIRTDACTCSSIPGGITPTCFVQLGRRRPSGQHVPSLADVCFLDPAPFPRQACCGPDLRALEFGGPIAYSQASLLAGARHMLHSL